MAIYNTYFSVLGLQDSLGVLPNLGVLPGLGRLDDLGEYAFSPASLFLNGEQGVWYDPSDLTPEKVSWRRNLLTYSQDFENAAWTKSNASILSNLLTYSQDFDNAIWQKGTGGSIAANGIIAPDGTTTADAYTFATSTPTFAYLSQSLTGTPQVAHTFSVYLKRPAGSGSRTVRLALSDVTVSTGNSTSFTVTEDWQQFTFTRTSANSTGNIGVGLLIGIGGTPIAPGEVLHVWGAQLVPGSTAQTYTRSLATAAPIQFADPLGGTLADKLVENTATSTHQLFQNYQASAAGGPVTFSFFVKSAERTVAILLEPNGIERTYNLSTGVATGAGASMIDFGNGWWRCIASSTFIDTAIRSYAVRLSNGTSTTYTGDGVSGILIYGAQLEQASTASAYQRITDFSSDFLAAFPTHALYQESTGVTPVTALGQSVGLVLDKRLGALTNIGAERVTNGNFASGSTGWTLPSGAVAIDGALVCTGLTSASNCVNVGTIVAGRWYQATFEIRNYITGSVSFGFGAQVLSARNAAGVYTEIFYATVSDFIDVRRRITDFTGTVDNISVREVPGNHALQATSAARPTLQARSNLLTYTEQFDNAAWTKTRSSITANTAVAPDGTSTADKLVEDTSVTLSHAASAAFTALTATYVVSCYLKSSGRTIGVLNYDSLSAWFNLANGTVGTVDAGLTASITDAGNGWYRCAIVRATTAGAKSVIVYTATTDGQLQYTGNGVDGILVWGAQLEQASTATTYQRVTTATDYADVGLPRNLTFDGIDDSLATAGNVDFATWTVGTRRNLLVNPTQFDASSWAVTQVSVTPNTAIAPDGTTTADKMVELAVASSHSVLQSVTTTAGVVYTYSVYVKKAERNFAQVRYENGGSTQLWAANVNLTDGTYTTATFGSPTSTSVAVTDAGNGWWRVALGVSSSNTTFQCIVFSQAVQGTNSYTGDGTSGIFLWGAQLEVGSTATAFQDVGTDKLTLFSGVFKPSDDATRVIAELSVDKNSNNGVFFLNTEAAPRWYFESKGTLASSTNSGAVTTFAAPVTSVVTGLGDIGGDASIIRVNGTQLGSNTANQGTGNYGSYPLYIGRRASLSLPFNGRLFQLVIRGAATDSVTVGNAERWVGQLTGVAL